MSTVNRRIVLSAIAFCSVLLLAPAALAAQNPCPRFTPGSVVTQPADLFSRDGVLSVNLIYYTTVDPNIPVDQAPNPVPPPFATGLQLFCFTTPDGQEQPTLHVWPGDHLIIHVKNNAPNSLVFEPDGTIDYIRHRAKIIPR